MLGLVALIIGLIIGLFLRVSLPANYGIYVALLILVLMDRILQAANRSKNPSSDDWIVVLGGAVADFLFASLLTGLGQQLGVPLYFAPIFGLGSRIFKRFQTLQTRLLQDVVRQRRKHRDDKEDPEAQDKITDFEIEQESEDGEKNT